MSVNFVLVEGIYPSSINMTLFIDRLSKGIS